MDGLRYSLDDSYYRLGPVRTCLYVRACQLVTGTSSQVPWNARGRRLVEPGVARVNKVSPVFLGYPLSVFNKNSTLKRFLQKKNCPGPIAETPRVGTGDSACRS